VNPGRFAAKFEGLGGVEEFKLRNQPHLKILVGYTLPRRLVLSDTAAQFPMLLPDAPESLVQCILLII